jgi:hypothetical protein
MTEENLEPKWSFNWKLAVAAWTVFLTSFFVPAYAEGSSRMLGWKCAWVSLVFTWEWYWKTIPTSSSLAGLITTIRSRSLEMHVGLLTLSNLVMIASPFCVFRRTRAQIWYGRTRLCAIAAFILAASLTVRGGIKFFEMGYWMWVISFGLLAFSVRRKKALMAPSQAGPRQSSPQDL